MLTFRKVAIVLRDIIGVDFLLPERIFSLFQSTELVLHLDSLRLQISRLLLHADQILIEEPVEIVILLPHR